MSEDLRRRVSVLVEDQAGRLLVDDLPGDVEFPGGGIEQGESIEEAAIREVMEEAGLRPVAVDTFGQRPTVADGQKTYWRRATGGQPDTSRLGADGDGMPNVKYMPKPQIKEKLRQPGGDPDVTEDEEKAMDKVSGFLCVLRAAGLEKQGQDPFAGLSGRSAALFGEMDQRTARSRQQRARVAPAAQAQAQPQSRRQPQPRPNPMAAAMSAVGRAQSTAGSQRVTTQATPQQQQQMIGSAQRRAASSAAAYDKARQTGKGSLSLRRDAKSTTARVAKNMQSADPSKFKQTGTVEAGKGPTKLHYSSRN